MTFEQKNKLLPNSMIKLYGEKEALLVRDRCYEIDTFFGDWVTKYIYDILWELPPLSFLEKSLVTIVSLSVLEKEEQLQIHFRGILNLGKSTDFAFAVLSYLKEGDYLLSLDKVLAVLNQAISSNESYDQSRINNINLLTTKEKQLITLAALVASGDLARLEEFLIELVSNKYISVDEMKAVFRHQMTYCGCPCTMNAFAILNEILK